MKRTLYLLSMAAGLLMTAACGKSASDQLAEQKLAAIHAVCAARVEADWEAGERANARDPKAYATPAEREAIRKYVYDHDMKACTEARLAQ